VLALVGSTVVITTVGAGVGIYVGVVVFSPAVAVVDAGVGSLEGFVVMLAGASAGTPDGTPVSVL